jgi:hypothetical protein
MRGTCPGRPTQTETHPRLTAAAADRWLRWQATRLRSGTAVKICPPSVHLSSLGDLYCGMRTPLCLLTFVLLAASLGADSAAGLRWSVPEGWISAPAQPMRAATYTLPVAPGAGGGECAIFFFGPDQGGGVQENIERWRSQVLGPDGAAAPAQVATRTIRGLRVTTLDSSGTYTAAAGPLAPAQPRPGYRLLGAIVEGPGGNLFIRLTGPAATVGANQQRFEELLASFQPD